MKTDKSIIDFMKPRERESISDDYLDSLVSNVMHITKVHKPIKIVPFYKKTIFWISNIAAVILIFILIKFNTQPNTIECNFDAVSKSELLAYIDENIEDFDQEMLMSYVPLKNQENFESEVLTIKENVIDDSKNEQIIEEPRFDKEQFNKINKKDILDYLDQEGLNYEDLESSGLY